MSTLIGVYRDHASARAAATAVRRSLDATASDIVVDDPLGVELARRAEMDAEVADSWASPGLGVFVTADQMRGAVLFAVIGAAIGLVPGAVIGLLLFTSSDDLITRLLVGALIGVLFGATVAALIGGGMAMQSTDRPLAYEMGVPVRVDNPASGTASVMSEFQPIRLDRFEDGQRVETIATSGAHGVAGTVQLFRYNAKEPRHRD